MTVNQLIRGLKAEQKAGNGSLKVHILAHDNCEGETQGEVFCVRYYKKDGEDMPGRDKALYDSLPNEVIYLKE